jgi:hypothetical protein
MSNAAICNKCGAQVAHFDFVCDFCGNVIFEHIKSTEQIGNTEISFDNGMKIIGENLNAMHDIPKPSIGATIKAALRIFFALYTFGIILIFWRRPKKRFHKETYNRLKNIVLRNISFLKLSSKGSSDLLARIKVYEDEYLAIDKAVNRGVLTKTIALAAIFVFYLFWLIYVINQEPPVYSTYEFKPYDTLVSGNMTRHFLLSPDMVKVEHSSPGKGNAWLVPVKIKKQNFDSIETRAMKFEPKLYFSTDYGQPVKEYTQAELSYTEKDRFIEFVNNSSKNEEFFEFAINSAFGYSDFQDTIPPHIRQFVLQIDTIR